jgi:7-cyano-7-deazaguanine tRNA-ribosyltransferase
MTTGAADRARGRDHLVGDRLVLPDGRSAPYPVFFPVHHREPMVTEAALARAPGMISNAFFFYKDRDIRNQVAAGLRLRSLVHHDGILMTDSGAFQGFQRPLHLSNRKIVRFQRQIGSDIISPLDLVTGPWEKRASAEQKLASTMKRVFEAFALAEDSLVAGVQQGGRFLDLRAKATEELLAGGARYIALGSLVPFLTRNHNVRLVIDIIKNSRQLVGAGFPLHLYGAGDPVELPLFVLAGANVFDSSSFAHFALAGWYMTPHGAVQAEQFPLVEWTCPCPTCADVAVADRASMDALSLSEHNFSVILQVIDAIRRAHKAGRLEALVVEVLEHHRRLFPDSDLMASADNL